MFSCKVIIVLMELSAAVFANLHDCWDPEKLQRMTFNTNAVEAADPGLSQFSKMVKCLSAQQGFKTSDGGENDFSQWSTNLAGGQFMPNWNTDQQQRNNKPNQQSDNSWGSQQNIPGGGGPGPGAAPSFHQPEPGVHPDDWGRVRTNDHPSVDPAWPPQQQPPRTGLGGSGGLGGMQREVVPPPPYKERPDRKRNRKTQQQQLPELEDRRNPIDSAPPEQQQYDSYNNPVGTVDVPRIDYPLMNQEETAAVSLSRKYGYAIMALSVVVLAVLMVATIFCCNSSNSTMSQAANQTLPVNQYDTYSMYSYKGGAGGGGGPMIDTLRSTGTMDMQTLKSVQSRGSPQYRVSDIDPDFARRYKENQQY